MIGDGDVQAAIATGNPNTGIDVLMGTGAPEGVIAAAALRCVGGNFQGRLVFTKDEQRARAKKMGVADCDKVHSITDLAAGKVMFCATGVTDGSMLKGVKYFAGGAKTHSMVMRSETGTVRFIEAEHRFKTKPGFDSL
ncbi:MAG: fructose-bisphosphatase class II [Bdellovibrionota bacterium]